MPNTESAKRALRKMITRRDRNRSDRSALRTTLKRVREAVATGNAEEIKAKFLAAIKALDQAAAGKLIHKNKGSRLKSRLAAFVAKGAAGAQATAAK